MKKKCILIFLLLGLVFNSFSQTTVIQGKITDDTGVGIPGAFVKHKQSNENAVADADGNYSIKIQNPQNAILIFSSIGFTTKEVGIENRININIELLNSVSKLNEVVITALGISREAKSLGYSRQGVNVEELTEARDPNIANMLAGKIAGLQLTTSGQPTGSSRIILRGVNSLTGENQPLWVIDGVPIDNTDGEIDDLDYGNGISNINPDDIASLEVLKGPNAAALYGSRAANGAILVTMKKGVDKGKFIGVSFGSNFMMSSVYQHLGYQNIYGEGNALRFVQSLNQIDPVLGVYRQGTFARSWGAPMLGQPYATFAGNIRTYVPQLDNIKDLYQTGFRATQNLSISKSDQTSSFRLSYTFANGNDVIDKQNLVKKHNVSLSASKDLRSYIKIETRLQYSVEGVQNRTSRALSPSSPLTTNVYLVRSVAANDFQPYKDENGKSFGRPLVGFDNPYWLINENYNEDDNSRIIGGITATIGITKFLKFRGQITADVQNGDGFVYRERDGIASPNGSYASYVQNIQNWNKEGLFMFKTTLSDFTLSANLGGNLRTSNTTRNTSSTSTLAAQDVMNISNAGGFVINRESISRLSVNSVYGTSTLGYKGYLYLDITGRNDWSSTLPKSNWSFFYPSVSTSFILSEAFELPELISYAKIRASVAKVGNIARPYNLFSAFNYGGNFNGTAYVDFDDTFRKKDLKPEQTKSTEMGIELNLFKKRISFDGTIYQTSTVNQIFASQVPSETGFRSSLINGGEIQNKGIELSLNSQVIKGKKFSWNLNLNYSMNRSKVIELAPGIDRFTLGNFGSLTVNAVVGQPIGVILGNDSYKATTGEVILRTNGIPYVQSLTNLGNFLPDWLGSVGSNFKYKSFDLGLNFGVKMGGDLFSFSNFTANTTGNTIQSLAGRDDWVFSTLVLGETGNELRGTTQINGLPYPDAARSKGIFYQGFYPLLDANGQIVYDANGRMMPGIKAQTYLLPQTYWQNTLQVQGENLFDASYIKLNQLILGYTLPAKLIKKTPFQTARLSLVGRNLWILYSNTPKGIDPESASSTGNLQGIENGGSLPYSTYGFDLKLTF